MLNLPPYLKITITLFGLILIFFVMYIGREIIVPLVFSLVIAILLNPMVNYFCVKGLNRVLAITTAILILFLILSGVVFFIGAQISLFWEALPELLYKFGVMLDETVNWLAKKIDIPSARIDAWIDKTTSEEMGISRAGVEQTISGIGSMVLVVFLVPVYVFLFLYYKVLLLEFIARLFGSEREVAVTEVLASTKTLVQSYLIGLLFEVVIVSILNITSLLVIGVDYAVALGIIGGILNLIPYIGGMVGVFLPMMIALLSGTAYSPILVLIAYMVIQVVDNNFVVPLVVASKVKVNALVSIVVVIIGGAMWGVTGMFLAIPLTAIVKVLSDKIPALSAFGLLIGDEIPEASVRHVQQTEGNRTVEGENKV